MPAKLSLFLPELASDLARRRLHLDPRCAIVLGHVENQREVVGACCHIASGAGVHAGMTIAHARGLLSPDLTEVLPFDAADRSRALRRLAEWALRAAPIVAVDEPDGLLLDASGCERLYRGVEPLIRRLSKSMRRFGLRSRVACAPTFGAAWALARFGGHESPVVQSHDVRGVLAPLPIEALRIDEEIVEQLHQVGIERIGELCDLPRAALADRYGEDLLLRLDQAHGEAVEVVTPVRSAPPVTAQCVFDGPTSRIEDIELAVHHVVSEVVGQLQDRESGCRRLDITLIRPNLEPLQITVRTSRPTRRAAHLMALLRPHVEKAQLGFGVDGVEARAHALARLAHEQHSTIERDHQRSEEQEIGRLVDTLRARLGQGGVWRVEPVESYIPERSFVMQEAAVLGLRRRVESALIDADRPSLLWRNPIPAQVVLLVPDGPIASVRLRGSAHQITTSIGPERIEPEWWRGECSARDYFKVQTDDGRWLWIYRDGATAQWFVHGQWA